ncbi:sigma factor [Parabacteroides chinchillae]|uniref:RNA polymerase sigma-70 factor, ECF subfamily n=1 Tax=Parabacteroides chinchillae TaxID=871327 RepID=A0A8G2BXZ1_9BACT|nr:sigma factor [Parabacteroides chinchillae]SEG11840.1 RNA polymerase sigma-70 factor, ECF subfamily [Parabacteroides chinchillae]
MAFRITGNKEQAEQIVQDAMLKVWSQRSTWMIIDDLPAYCLMVTRNIALKSTMAILSKCSFLSD